MIELNPEQLEDLRRFGDGEPHAYEERPNTNLVRRNLVTKAPGLATYRLTAYGRAALMEQTQAIIDWLRGEADLSENGLDFMDDSELVAETREHIVWLRRAADEIERLRG